MQRMSDLREGGGVEVCVHRCGTCVLGSAIRQQLI